MNYNYNRLSQQQQYQPPILPSQQQFNQPNYNRPLYYPQLNINNNPHQQQQQQQQQEYLPTFFNRLFGLPSHDAISLLKFKLKMIRTVLISFGFVVICIYFMVSNSLNRTTTIALEYEDQIALPLIAFNFNCDESLLAKFTLYINNPSNNSYDVIAAQGENSIFNVWNITGFYGNCVYYNNSMFFLLDDCIYLKDQEQVSFNIYILGYDNFNIGLLFNSQFYFSNSTQQLISGFTKSMKSDQYGNVSTSYQASWAISPSQKGYMTLESGNFGYMLLSYGFYYYSNVVLMETTQTNFQLIIASLSNIGSAFSLELMVVGILFAQITKLLIRDKSAWIDDEIRECIIHHSNQINLKNIKSVLNNTNEDDLIDDDTCSVNSTSRNSSSSYIGYDFNKSRNKRKSTIITMARPDYSGINDYVDNEEEENEFNQDINKITKQQDSDDESTITTNNDQDKDEESENNNYFLLDDK